MGKKRIITFIGELPFSDNDERVEGLVFNIDLSKEEIELKLKKLFQFYIDFSFYDSDDNSIYDGRMETDYCKFEFNTSIGIEI